VIFLDGSTEGMNNTMKQMMAMQMAQKAGSDKK
jgi:hypothetical protein